MFTKEHLIWIGLCVVFVALMTLICVKRSLSLRRAGYIMTAICVLSETSKTMGEMVESSGGGMVLDPRSLPFHLCSLMLFGVLIITFGKDGAVKQWLINFMAVAGVLGSICAILIPTNGTDFRDIGSYQCFVYHAGLLWFSLYLIISKNAHLGGKTLFRNLLLLGCFTLAMLYINSILSMYNTNFMFLVRPPMKNLPILNLDDGWDMYFLRLSGIGLSVVSLYHLPFIIAERMKNRRDKTQ